MTAITRSFRAVAFATLLATTTVAVAQSTPAKPSMDPAKLHQKLVDRTIGKGIKVAEVDGSIVTGTLVAIEADSFQVTPKGAAHPVQVMNSTVVKIGNTGLSTGAKIGIGIAIGIAIFIIYIAAALKSSGF